MQRHCRGLEKASTHLIAPDDREKRDQNEIARTKARTISKNFSTANHSDQFRQHKATEEGKKSNYTSNREESHNGLFLLSKMRSSLRQAKDTATKPDDIHYQLPKIFP